MRTFIQLTFSCIVCLLCITHFSIAQQGSGQAATLGNLTRINPEKKGKEENMLSREVSKEIAVPKNGEIFIDCTSRNVLIKTWEQQKVKITTTVFYEGDPKLTEEEWLEKAGLTLKVVGSSVKIKSINVGLYTINNVYGSATNAFGVSRNAFEGVSFGANGKKITTIFLPAGSKIDVESNYSDISIPANLGDVNVDITSGNMDAEKMGKLILRSKYANITTGDIKNAEIEMTNGRFTGGSIDELDMDTKYSNIEIAVADKVIIRSINDEYEIEEVGEMNGRKNYGNLRITKLFKSINLEGANADVKIRSLAPTVSLIKIDNKYADIRIPLKSVKNYQVDFTGYYSSVYGNFEKQALALSEKEMQTLKPVITSVGKLNNLNVIDRAPSITSLGTLTNITVTGVVRDASGKLVSAENSKSSNITTGTITSVAPAYVFSGTLSENNGSLTTLAPTSSMTVSGRITPAVSAMVPNTVSGSLASAGGHIEGGTFKGTLSAGTIQGFPTTISATTVPGTYGTMNGGSLYATNRYNYSNDNDTPSKFTATVGDGKGLKIEMKCLNCTVDFK